MTPALLATYLRTLREAGCMSAELVIPEGTVRAVFSPEPLDLGVPLNSDQPVPGGWKGDDQ